MHLWQDWIGLLQDILHVMAVNWGLGTGLAVIVLTTGVRASLIPLTWSLAYRAALRQAKLAKLAPALKLIREQHATDRHAQMQKTLELHRQHGLSMADGKGLLGALLQMPVIYGLYKALSSGVGATAFLWIRNLARPDRILAVLAAISTAAAMAAAPHMSEQARLMIILVPAILCFVAALHFSSGVALYWITTNLFSAAQALALRHTLRRAGTA
ncbi:MAG TPA: membrane protein insertase YidC [Steroidobacteraceae bacterium]|jgi:YidC/Oxa1 family membrane protein insertase|nr:membrane protein insertase YidC [Steroidobacteraceae bacterium]